MFQTVNTSDSTTEQAQICKETQVGVAFYRVVVVDVAVDIFISICLPWMQIRAKRLSRYCGCADKAAPKPEDENSKLMEKDVALADVELDEVDPALANPNDLYGADDADADPDAGSDSDAKAADDKKSDDDVDNEEDMTAKQKRLLAYAKQEEEDKLKSEFNISENLIDLMYRQALVWSGTPFCPALPLLIVVCMCMLIWVKRWQVMRFTVRPKKPMGVAKQNRFFRGTLIITLIISFIPYTFFLRRIMECGPHKDQRIVDNMLEQSRSLPSWAAISIDYLSNALLLWVLLVLAFTAILFLNKQYALLKQERDNLKHLLSIEATEKRVIIRRHNIKFDVAELTGKEQFRTWVTSDIGFLGEIYGPKIIEWGKGDMNVLMGMHPDDVESMMVAFDAPEGHIALFQRKLEQRRLEEVRMNR